MVETTLAPHDSSPPYIPHPRGSVARGLRLLHPRITVRKYLPNSIIRRFRKLKVFQSILWNLWFFFLTIWHDSGPNLSIVYNLAQSLVIVGNLTSFNLLTCFANTYKSCKYTFSRIHIYPKNYHLIYHNVF